MAPKKRGRKSPEPSYVEAEEPRADPEHFDNFSDLRLKEDHAARPKGRSSAMPNRETRAWRKVLKTRTHTSCGAGMRACGSRAARECNAR